MTDPWARTPPATDPWQSNASTGAISKQPQSQQAMNALQANSVENWLNSTGSNRAAAAAAAAAAVSASNGNGNFAATTDPWLAKQSQKEEQSDPWLNKSPPPLVNDAWNPANSKSGIIDPWAPTTNNIGVCVHKLVKNFSSNNK